MKSYDDRKKIIGNRIKEEREKLGLSQKELLPQIYKSEKSHKMLSAWENGERIPDLDSLSLMADLFGCDIGYLLGDYAEHNYVAADICGKTGLSESAVENLVQMHTASNGDDYLTDICRYLSFLLERNLLVQPVIDASKCVDAALAIRHYQNDVLPSLETSSEVNEYLLQFKVDKINSDDIEKLYQTTKITDEIKKLRDTYSAKRYFCEKGAADAISSFVDHMEKQYGLDTE